MAKTIEELLRSVKENGIVCGSEALRLGGLRGNSQDRSYGVCTLPLNPIFTDSREIYDHRISECVFNSVEMMSNYDFSNFYTEGPYVLVDACIGDFKAKLVLTESHGFSDDGLKNLSVAAAEQLQSMWLYQVIYSMTYGLSEGSGLIEAGLQRETREIEMLEPVESRIINNVLYLIPIDKIKDCELYAHLYKPSANSGCAGEITVQPKVEESSIDYVLIPEKISSIAQDIGFSGKLVKVGYVPKANEYTFLGRYEYPDYESAIKQILSDDKRQFLAHIMRLPIDGEITAKEALSIIEERSTPKPRTVTLCERDLYLVLKHFVASRDLDQAMRNIAEKYK